MTTIHRIEIAPNVTVAAVEVDFEPKSEPWSEYELADGGRFRIRATVQRLFHLVDDNGRKLYDDTGAPLLHHVYAVQNMGHT